MIAVSVRYCCSAPLWSAYSRPFTLTLEGEAKPTGQGNPAFSDQPRLGGYDSTFNAVRLIADELSGEGRQRPNPISILGKSRVSYLVVTQIWHKRFILSYLRVSITNYIHAVLRFATLSSVIVSPG